MKHIAILKNKPERSGKESIPDGAICGNGDLSVILGNCENGLRLHIAKSDMWYLVERYDSGGLRPFGNIDIPIEASLYDNYYVEQDMDNGEIRCLFKNGNEEVKLTVRVCKGENSIMLENDGNVDIKPKLCRFTDKIDGVTEDFNEDGIHGICRLMDGKEVTYPTMAFGTEKQVDGNKWYYFIATNHDCDNPKETAVKKAKEISVEKFDSLKKNHYDLWREFWSKSSFKMSDEEFELGWYASQYMLAVSAGNEKFPPGIFANFITVETPMWHSDYHLNYNYQAPFYHACSSNHVEFTDCYHAPLEDFYERGRECAEKFGCRGIMYPVGMMPKGIFSEMKKELKYWFPRLFLGQKSNAIHPADIMVFRWKTTRDKEYAKNHAYPYIRECLAFFEDYMTFENGRYSVKQDACHEVPYYKPDFNPKKYKRYINDTNNALTLGLLRMCLEAEIDMAKALGIDEDKQKEWQNILDKLSPFATYYRFFRKVYRYTEKGQMWNDSNDVGLQHIYPCGCIGLSSPKEDLKIARETFRQKSKHCWLDGNAVCSFYPMAARLGIDPKKITSNLRENNRQYLLPNMIYKHGGGCLENCSIIANTFNEMALQSHQNILRFFPAWDTDIDCEFENLRSFGAFLVSASIKKGVIGTVTIKSECGEKLSFVNPFDKCRITVNGKTTENAEKEITMNTSIGDVIIIEKA